MRIRSLCDAHLRLRVEEMGDQLVKVLEVAKVRGAAKTTGNIISSTSTPDWECASSRSRKPRRKDTGPTCRSGCHSMRRSRSTNTAVASPAPSARSTTCSSPELRDAAENGAAPDVVPAQGAVRRVRRARLLPGGQPQDGRHRRSEPDLPRRRTNTFIHIFPDNSEARNYYIAIEPGTDQHHRSHRGDGVPPPRLRRDPRRRDDAPRRRPSHPQGDR